MRDEVAPTRWLFGDQLGPWFLGDHPDHAPVLLIESAAALGRRRWHRKKLHLVLSAMRHRAAELGDRCRYVRAGSYREGLAGRDRVSVCEPTSWAAERFVRALGEPIVDVVPSPGFATHRDEIAGWARDRGDRRLLLEDFVRWQRQRHDVLLEADGEPAGGRWNFDADNREPPPRGASRLDVPPPAEVAEDAIDEEVRSDLDGMVRDGAIDPVGEDGPRWFPATRDEALAALGTFVRDRLPAFGPHEDAILAEDRVMAHSLLSAPLNLGLLHPLEVVRAAEDAFRRGDAPIASVEGFVRQVLGWREYIWGLYWFLGEAYRRKNVLGATEPVPAWLDSLDAEGEVRARCLSTTLRDVREEGWTHHIPRLMVLGSYAMQRGVDPAALTDWFHRSFVDGYDWVMVPNVVGMSQHADGGILATKPYTSGGAYIDRMSDLCGECPYDPKVRVGPNACPFTAGYWWFLDRHRDRFTGNARMRRAVAGVDRRDDLEQIRDQEDARGTTAP